MPNGDPHFNRTEQDAWFEAVSEPINQFASRHGLYLDKYYHDSPTWDLRFGHPLGGNASIHIMNAGSAVRISSVWYLDDYDEFTRYLNRREILEIPRDARELTRALASELTEILRTPLGRWNDIASGYEGIWSRYSKAEFQSLGPNYSPPTNVPNDV